MERNNESKYHNTEEDTLIWHYSNGFSKDEGDIRWALINLYKTTSGEYYLHVSGGPGSDYAAKENISTVWGDGVIYTSGEAIIPMSQQNVIVWGEEYLPDDILSEILRDIKKKAKHDKTDIPKILELSEQKISMRGKEREYRLATDKVNAEIQSRRARFYEQFVEL